MDCYQGYEEFMTSYEVDEASQKITIEYADKTKTTVIDSNHNRNVMTERLYNQHQEIKNKLLPHLEQLRGIEGCAVINFMAFVGVELVLAKTSSTISSVVFIMYFGRRWMYSHKQISRFQLMDYCLEHADSIQLTKDSFNSHLHLSDAGEKAFELDHGFSLNHAHLYTDHDLRVLKKINKQKSLQEKSHE